MKADDNIPGKIFETLNKILNLPTEKKIARFTAQFLFSLPGISACRVCLGNNFSQKGKIDPGPCKECTLSRQSDKEISPLPEDLQCGLDRLPGSYILPVETVDYRFGYFIFSLDRDDLFEEYKPFIQNLGNYIALNLETRLQKIFLKKGNDALEEEEKRYRTLLSSVTDYIYSVEVRDGRPVSTIHSPNCMAVTGYTPEEYKADPDLWYRMVHEEDRTDVEEQAAHILAGKEAKPLEHRIIHRNGSLRWVRNTAVPRCDRQGHYMGYDGLIQDITDRKKAEEALKTERTLLDRITETSPVSITMVSREGEIVFANRQAEELLGLTKSEIMQRTYNAPDWKITDLKGGPYPDEKLPFRLVMEGRTQVSDIRHAIEWPDGRSVYLSINGAPLFDENSEIESVVFTIEDITQRVKNEEILRENQELLLEAQHIAHIGNWWHDLATGEMFWSHEFFRILGREPQKPTPELAFKVIYPDDLHIVEKAMEESAAGKRENEHDFRIVRPDGEIRWIHNHWVTLYDENGNDIKHIGTHQDITEQIRSEQERLNYLHFLESMSSTSRAIHGSDELEKMMTDVLDVMLSTFDCDRAWLVYPCDPGAPTWTVPMERTKPEYPGVKVLGEEVPMDAVVGETHKRALASDGPVKFGPGTEHQVPEGIAEQFDVKSYIMIALHPKVGKPWLFGMHQCSYPRRWTAEEEKLFHEISRRLEDALTTLLSYRHLHESEERYRLVFENSPVSIWEEDFSGVKTLLDGLREEGVDNIESYFVEHPEFVRQCAELVKVLDVNHASLTLHVAVNKEELLKGLVNTFTPESFGTFRQELVCLWNGGTEMRSDAVLKTLAGDLRTVTVYFSVCPGFEETLSRVIVSLVDITERKHAEEALQKSESLLSASQHLARVGGWEYDVKSGTFFWTGELYRIHEIPEDPSIDHMRESINCYDPKDRPVIEKAFQKAYKQGKSYDLEFPFTTYKGNHLWIRTTAQPVYEEGKVTRVVGNLMDITERKVTERELQKSNDLLRAIIEAAPVAIIGLDLEGKVRSVWNPAAEKMLGWSAGEAMGNYLPTVPVEKKEEFRKFREWIKSGQTLDGIEARRQKKNGEPVDYSIYASPLYNQEGHITGNIAVLVDITDRKRKDEALRNTSIRLTEAQRIARIGSWEMDIINNKLSWTDEIYKIFEIDPEKFGATYEAFLDTVHPDDREAVHAAYTDSLKTKKPYTIDHRLLFPDGRVKYVHEQGETYFENGKPVRSMGTVQDVTEQKIIEKERLDHLHYLESMGRINRAIQGAGDLEQMMRDVLDEILSIFDSDRAFLMYPCDPESDTWSAPMERNKPEYPGVLELNLEIPMDRDVAETLRILLAAEGAVQFGPGTPHPLPEDVSEQFGFKCFMSMAIYPKIGSPWQFGMHQCSHARIWTGEEERLFQEIGRRLEDALTSLLSFRNLQESEERYRMVFENSPVSLWEEDFSGVKAVFDQLKSEGVTDIGTYFDRHPEVLQKCVGALKIINVNRSTLELNDAVDTQELLSFLAVPTQSAKEHLRNILENLWKGATKISDDYDFISLKGKHRYVTSYVSVCPGYEKTYSKILASLVDVTDRKAVEEKLRQSEQRLRLHVEQSSLGFLEWDDQFRAAEWNAACERIFGYTRKEAIGKHAKELVLPAEVHDLVDGIFKSLMEQTGGRHSINENITKDGRIIICEWFNTTLTDKNGKGIAVASVCRDITEQKKMEEELARYRDRLEELVRDRTVELETANRELEAFAYSVSHDLRAPLRHIDGFMELLKTKVGTDIDEKTNHYFSNISSASLKMGMLIDDLLSFSRMGRQAMSFKMVNLGDIVHDVIREQKEDASGRDLVWNIGELPVVSCDISMIRIVMINLVSNAVKFTQPRDQAVVEIGSSEQESEVIVFVRDNGVGFEPEYSDKLFAVFHRLHRIEEFEGTGVGLAIAQRIINRHGGRIWAEGEPDKGATFYFSLPK